MNRFKTIWRNWPVWLQVTFALSVLWLSVRIGTFLVVLIVTLITSNLSFS